MPVESFKKRVERLAKERSLSVSQVGSLAWNQGINGTSQATLNAAMQGRRRPGKHLIEAVATTLGVEPTEFAEYGLAALRAVPDERKVGLELALSEAQAAAATVLAVAARIAEPEDEKRDRLLELQIEQALEDGDEPGEKPESGTG